MNTLRAKNSLYNKKYEQIDKKL